jgi:hypothetical protein
MAVPWQGDTIFCRSGYEPEFDPYVPSFWPARVPNQVLSETEYLIVMNTNLPRAQRLAAFKKRRSWVRNMKGSASEQILQMVNEFGTPGVIEARPGLANDPDFPAIMYVESLPPALKPASGSPPFATSKEAGAPPPPGSQPRAPRQDRSVESSDPVIQAGWENAAQLEEFRRIRFR